MGSPRASEPPAPVNRGYYKPQWLPERRRVQPTQQNEGGIDLGEAAIGAAVIAAYISSGGGD